MSRNIVLGKRANGDIGVFVAPPGYDAYTALDKDLTLSVHSKMDALLKIGYVTTTTYVPLGFGARPVVILSGLRSAFTGVTGLTKPSPFFYGMAADSLFSYASVASDGSGMTVVAYYTTRYEVYNSGGV